MAEVFEIYVKNHFSAAHSLRGYEGDCERVHGHNWMVEVYVRCAELNEIGIGIDFKEIKSAVGEVLGSLDHRDLNELSVFEDANPTSENIARFIYKELSRKFGTEKVRVSRVKVSETPGTGAFYWEE